MARVLIVEDDGVIVKAMSTHLAAAGFDPFYVVTPTEFRLLQALALERGLVVTRDELMQRLWGRRQTRRDRTVDVFVRKLREKVDGRALHHDFIHTRYGVGYKFEPIAKDGHAPASVSVRAD